MLVIRCSGIEIFNIQNFTCSCHFKCEINIAFLPQPLWNFTHASTEFHGSVFPCSREQTLCITDVFKTNTSAANPKIKVWKAVHSTTKVFGEGQVQPMVSGGKVCLEAFY